MRGRSHGWRLLADRRGVAAVEFAIGGLVLFGLMFGIVNLGDLAWTYDSLHEGAVAAARYASVTTSNNLGTISASSISSGVCAETSKIQSRFAARITPPIAASSAPPLAVIWGGSLTLCNAGTGNVAIATLPGGWVDVSATYVWQPLAMSGVFGGVTIRTGDIEPVLNAPLS
ncbi:pilus assembly protein [Acidiphilium sp. AL]|uniref:Pilus assembly protein n=1 Tax=Acidiphilium iwatense TaxID=768198 RepID=A0ABS9DW35_9PROT|nr:MULTISPECIES: TadE/TadG family type IV pilus assembly protein [Acidiphilium]MCF3946385.1 pilus assembly protein [Acidiphilium iwatense]MCU4159832.1 pilus assembly protein [Acidiphilium sp. AL]